MNRTVQGGRRAAAAPGLRRERVRMALDQIPAEQMLALALLLVEGLTADEAAHVLELSPRTVRALCDRAMTNLRRATLGSAPRRPLRAPASEVDRLALRRAM